MAQNPKGALTGCLTSHITRSRPGVRSGALDSKYERQDLVRRAQSDISAISGYVTPRKRVSHPAFCCSFRKRENFRQEGIMCSEVALLVPYIFLAIVLQMRTAVETTPAPTVALVPVGHDQDCI